MNKVDFSKCIFACMGKCGPFNRKHVENAAGFTTLRNLDNSLDRHAKELGVDLTSFSERSLIMNRAHIVSDDFESTSLICPYHRYNFGISWRPSMLCQLPYHDDTKAKAVRRFSYPLCQLVTKLERYRNKNFCYSVGQPVCRSCLMKFTKDSIESEDDLDTIPEDTVGSIPRTAQIRAREKIRFCSAATAESQCDVAGLSQMSTTSSVSMFEDEISLHEVNQILQMISNDIPYIKYQVRQDVAKLSHRTLRELQREYDIIIETTATLICESMAPGQGQTLKEVLNKSKTELDEQEELSDEIRALLDAYLSAPSNKWKIFLLSTLPQNIPKAEVQKIFSCSRHMVNKSRTLRRSNEQFDIMKTKAIRRQRIQKSQLEFFFHFLFTSGLIQDAAFGTTTMHFDTDSHVIVPYVIRTMMKSHIQQLYERHCEQVCYLKPLSRNTVLRLLDICKMREKKTLCGLDSFVVDGMIGFDTLEKLIPKLVSNREEEKHFIKLLSLSKNYLKVEYKLHVAQNDSTCFTHCRSFALCHEKDKSFQVKCDHSHSFSCIQCNTLLALLCRLQTLASMLDECNEKDELLYDLKIAIEDILELMFHILRGVQQDESKKFVLEKLDYKSGLLLSDWSMKITTQQHREKMEEWFGKRGISLHVDVLFYIENNILRKVTYFTAIDRCPQDMVSVLAVFEHVLKQIRQDFLRMKNLYSRSDNAGCYSGASAIFGRHYLCTNAGFELKRTDFNEPHRGKDQADRDIAVAKSCIRAFVDRGGNLTNAKAVKEALDSSFGSLSGSKTSVLSIDGERSRLPKVKVTDITKYHSVAFSRDSVNFWQYFGIGSGRNEKMPQCQFVSRSTVVLPFSTQSDPKEEFVINTSSPDVVLFCSDPACCAMFDCEADLIEHQESNDHIYSNETSLSTEDRARHIFIDHLKGARLLDDYASTVALNSILNSSSNEIHDNCSNCTPRSIFSKCGYAIRKRKQLVKLTDKHNQFFQKLFDDGEQNGKKYTVEKAHEEMRYAHTHDNVKLFVPAEYLSRGQIRSLFGRLFRKKVIKVVKSKEKRGDSDDEEPSSDDSRDHEQSDQDPYFNLEQEQTMDTIIGDQAQHALQLCDESDDDDFL